MGDEIIKVLDYLMNNPALQGIAIIDIIMCVVVFALVIGVFVFTFINIIKGFKDF